MRGRTRMSQVLEQQAERLRAASLARREQAAWTRPAPGRLSQERRSGGVLLATRIHLPEAAAASFRLDGVERALAGHGVPVRVLTTTPPAREAEAGQAGSSTGSAAGSPSGAASEAGKPAGGSSGDTSVAGKPAGGSPSAQPSAGRPSSAQATNDPATNGTAVTSQAAPVSQPEGVVVSRWPALRDSSGYLRGYLPYMSFDLPLPWRFLAQPRPDVVLVEPPPTTGVVMRLASRLRGVPYVWYAPDVWSLAAESTGAPGVVLRAVRAMESFAVSGADRVIAVNEEVAQRVRDLGARSVVVVPNGIDTSVFDADGPVPSAQERAEMGITGPYAVYAGTASEWQDAGVFARALAAVREQVPGAQVLYLGQGSDWDKIAEVAAQVPAGADGSPAVVMHGLLPPEQAAAWMRGAACALVSIRPGVGYDFAYPTKVLAALACGVPVVYAGPGPVVDDVREHALGWACEHEDGAVAQAMVAAFRAAAELGEPGAAEVSTTADGEPTDQGEAAASGPELGTGAEPAGTSDPAQARREHLRGWVQANRSLQATGEAVASTLRQVVLARRRGRGC